MNCGICKAYLRQNNPCYGCNYVQQNEPKTRAQCYLRLCTKRKGQFCFNCIEFPCDKLKRLDKRYQTKYGMSEIENLIYIRDNGIKKFIEKEFKRWVSDKGILCINDKKHYNLSGEEINAD